ncbi:MAG: glycosyltransferase family 2 protein [Oscillospiraceae bacterium]
MSKAKVSACIVTYKCYDKCREAISTMVENTKGVELTIYIVDNNSLDGSLQRLREEFPQIVAIQKDDNRGFGHGHNAVLDILDSEYHCVVNPDITFDCDAISALCDYLDKNEDVAIVTPEVQYPGGEIQIIGKRNPTFLALFGRHLLKKRLSGIVRHYQMLDEDLTKPIDIEFATGCFFVIRTSVFQKMRGFDERFFMYFEDMDITRRARTNEGMRAVYYPYTHVFHEWERASSHRAKFFVILVIGMFKYFGKWGFQFNY